MLADMRDTAPAPVFEATLDIARQQLDATGWARLARSLGLSPAAGLVGA